MNCRTLSIAAASVLVSVVALGTVVFPPTLEEKVRDSAAIIEVRIEAVRSGRDEQFRTDTLVCACTVLQGFKAPTATNKLTLTVLLPLKGMSYAGKTYVVFASNFPPGSGYRAAASGGMIEKGSRYFDPLPPKEKSPGVRTLTYDDLIREIKVLTRTQKGEPDGAANGSHPIRSETNRTPSAAGSRR